MGNSDRRLSTDREFFGCRWKVVGTRLQLSPRELQIIIGILNDRREAEIAAELGISIHTVHTYFKRIFQKLRVNNKTAVAVSVLGEVLTMILENSTAD